MPKKYDYIRKTFTFNGQRYTVRGKTEKEAVRKMVEKQIALEQGSLIRGGNTLVKNWYKTAYEVYKPKLSYESQKQSMYRVEKHIISDIGNYPISQITPLMCQRIMNRQAGRSRSHIEKLSQELFFLFDTARKNGMIAKNPAEDIVKPDGTVQKRRALTAYEREHLLKVIPLDPRFVFFELMLYCGCRPSEAAGVMYEDVTQIDGIPFLHIRGTKTANSDRFVPLPEELHPKLLNSSGNGFCAVTQAGTRHNESSYKRMVEHLKRELNISMGCTVYRNQLIEPLPLASDFVPYLLRHTYCTDLKKKGVDVRIAKDLMGHSDIKTTANIYDHCDDDTLMLAARQMGLA